MNVSPIFAMSPWIWLAIVVVVILMFGARELPELAKALGQSKRALKEGLADSTSNHDEVRRGKTNGETETLSSVDDATLFEEASRRARLRREQSSKNWG
jgi:TatA/E family protein of Tat protein translocase